MQQATLEKKNKEKSVKSSEDEFTLVLRDGEKVIFASRKRGLRPLLECVAAFAGKLHGAFLIDNVAGTAAARLIVASQMIARVQAKVISEGALRHLSDHSIQVEWREKTDNILKADERGLCPMEELSKRFLEDEEFIPGLFAHFSIKPPKFLSGIPEC